MTQESVLQDAKSASTLIVNCCLQDCEKQMLFNFWYSSQNGLRQLACPGISECGPQFSDHFACGLQVG